MVKYQYRRVSTKGEHVENFVFNFYDYLLLRETNDADFEFHTELLLNISTHNIQRIKNQWILTIYIVLEICVLSAGV